MVTIAQIMYKHNKDLSNMLVNSQSMRNGNKNSENMATKAQTAYNGKEYLEDILNSLIKFCDSLQENNKDDIDDIILNFMQVDNIKKFFEKQKQALKSLKNDEKQISALAGIVDNGKTDNLKCSFSDFYMSASKLSVAVDELKKLENNKNMVKHPIRELTRSTNDNNEYAKKIKKILEEGRIDDFHKRSKEFTECFDGKWVSAIKSIKEDLVKLHPKNEGNSGELNSPKRKKSRLKKIKQSLKEMFGISRSKKAKKSSEEKSEKSRSKKAKKSSEEKSDKSRSKKIKQSLKEMFGISRSKKAKKSSKEN